MIDFSTQRPARTWAVMAGVLMVVYLAIRLPGLMALPIFGDEAIYLRYAQFVLEGEPFLSITDPKPPLHFWLIAVFLWCSDDPLVVARMVSVVAGMLTIPALIGLCAALEPLVRHAREEFIRRGDVKPPVSPPTGVTVGIVAVLLAILCPYLAFYQRLALADALVVLENVAILCVGAMVATRVWDGSPPRQAAPAAPLASAEPSAAVVPAASPPMSAPPTWPLTIVLGVLIGLSLLTRQIVSYIFPFIVVWAFVLMWQRDRQWRPAVMRFALRLAVAGVIAAVLWSPFFFGFLRGYHQDRDAANPLTRQSFLTEFRNRVLYQQNFAPPMTLAERANQIATNAKTVFVPSRGPRWTPGGDLATGWLWVYLTPGVYIVSLLGVAWMAARRQWPMLAFLLGWFAMLVGPLILLGAVSYSRYALSGALPLLLIAAFAAVDAVGCLARRSGALAWSAAVALGLALFVAPLRDIHLQANRWWNQPMVGRDRYQYITGSPAGLGSRAAATYLQELARETPIVVLTGAEWGNPADALWAYLHRRPGVTLYWLDDLGGTPAIRKGPGGGYVVRPGKWSYAPPIEATFPPGALVIVAVNHPVHVVTRGVESEASGTDFLERAGNGKVEDLRIFPIRRLISRGEEGEQVLLWIVGTVGKDGAILPRLQAYDEIARPEPAATHPTLDPR